MRDLIDAHLRHAEVRERPRVSGFVDDLSERGAAVAELALQCARADVENLRDFLLGGLAVLQALREHRTHPCLHVVPLDARQVTRRDGITQARELRSEEHTSELQSQSNLVCRLLLEKKT